MGREPFDVRKDQWPMVAALAIAAFGVLSIVAVGMLAVYRALAFRAEPPARAIVAQMDAAPAVPVEATGLQNQPPPKLDSEAYEAILRAYRDNRITADDRYEGTRWRFEGTFREFGFRLSGSVQVHVLAFGNDTTILRLSESEVRSLHAGQLYIFDGSLDYVSTTNGVVDFTKVALVGPAPIRAPKIVGRMEPVKRPPAGPGQGQGAALGGGSGGLGGMLKKR